MDYFTGNSASVELYTEERTFKCDRCGQILSDNETFWANGVHCGSCYGTACYETY